MVYRYTNPGKAPWPTADFVVGNPPFLGNKRLRQVLSDEYVDVLREAYPEVGDSADLFMYWWRRGAEAVARGEVRRCGLISTNSLPQVQSRKIVQDVLGDKRKVRLDFAIPDHPWLDTATGAAVRIALSVVVPGHGEGSLVRVLKESAAADGDVDVQLEMIRGVISADLRCGANVAGVRPLQANGGLCFMGVTLVGEGFRLQPEDLGKLGLSRNKLPPVVRRYVMGRDLAQQPAEQYVIDFFGVDEREAMTSYPRLYQHVHDHVRDQRQQNKRQSYRDKWWIFGEPRTDLRKAVAGTKRVILTNFAAKHRFFVFWDARDAIDHNVYVIAIDDPFVLGCLSARPHLAWMVAAGSKLEDRKLWINSTCFLPFAFPQCNATQRKRIGDLAEALDRHRKTQQAEHPKLAVTDMYNVMEKLRSGEPLSAKEQLLHGQGVVSVLRKLHDDLDAAVLDAYGWSRDLTDEQLLSGLVELNAKRVEEESKGLIRWLRPDYQQVRLKPAKTEMDRKETGPGLKKSAPPKGPGIAPARQRSAAKTRKTGRSK